jgi:hypothetical protein
MRQTKKYVAAVETSKKSGLRDWATQEGLYELLKCNGYMWDSKTGEWLYLPEMAADAPSPLIKMRVWADMDVVKMVADTIASAMPHLGGELVDRSEGYPCRPPKQLEGRVYLTFKPK